MAKDICLYRHYKMYAAVVDFWC